MPEADTTTATTTPAVEDNSPVATPPTEPTTSAPTVDAPASDAPQVATPEAPAPEALAVEPERPSRAQSRIQELSAKLKEAGTQPSYVPQFTQSPTAPKLSELVAGQDSINPEQLDQLGNQVFQQGAQTGQGLSSLEVQALRQEMAQKEAINNYSSDEVRVEQLIKDAGLDGNSVLDAKIAKEYQARAVKQTPDGRIIIDPNVRLTDIAKENIELAKSSAETGRAQTSANLEALQDNGAVIPNSDAVAPPKAFEDMTLKEMEAHLRTQGRDV